jgi:glycine/D-amino acid oxidase-like deaminating enzyme
MLNKQHVIIVGGGSFGMSAAIELRQRGWVVDVFDPGPIPYPLAATTDISKVLRMDYGADEDYMIMMEQAFEVWDAWNRAWKEPLWHETGFVIMKREEMKPGSFEFESYRLLKNRGHKVDRLDGQELKRRFPAWNAERYTDGYYNPRAGWVESGRVLEWLYIEAQKLGVRFHLGEKFSHLLDKDSRVIGIQTEAGEKHLADFVIMASGAWTPHLLPYLSEVLWTVFQPVFHFQVPDVKLFTPPNLVVWAADIATTGWYGFPAIQDRRFKIANHGSGWRFHPDEPRVMPADQEEKFRGFLRGTFPALADAPVLFNRLCAYCDSWDGDLWIDHDPDRPGLLVATGDSGHAFKFTPLLGRIIADVLERRPRRFASKFAWRVRGTITTEDARFSRAADG